MSHLIHHLLQGLMLFTQHLSGLYRRQVAASVPEEEKHPPENLLPDAKVVFTVHADGVRTYPLIENSVLLDSCAEILQAIEFMTLFTSNEWRYGIRPFIDKIAQLMGSLPASEGVHDFQSGGLFCHSARVCLRALRSYREELLMANFYNHAEARLKQAAIIYQAFSHDVGKILTDFEVTGTDGTGWDPRQESFYIFSTEHCEGYYQLSFLSGRGMTHKERNVLCIGVLLPYLQDFLKLCRTLTSDPEELLEGNIEVKTFIANADIFDVADQSPLRTQELFIPDYLRAMLAQQLNSGKFSVNELDSSCYVTDFGLLTLHNGDVHRFLVKTFDALVSERDKGVNDNFVNYCKPKGLLLLTGERAVYSWYLLHVEDEIMFCYGLMLRCNFKDRFGSCYCRHLGTGEQTLSAVLEFFNAEKKNVSRFTVYTEKQGLQAYTPEDLKAYAEDSHSLSQEKKSAARRRYTQKNRLKRTITAEREQLEELYSLCHSDETVPPVQQSENLPAPD